MDTRPRNMTQADVDAIADALYDRVSSQFYKDIGKGIWSVLWKALLGAAVVFGAIGHWGNK